MKYEEVKKYEGKQVLILLKNKFRYSGVIKAVNQGSIVLNDKFKQDVLIDIEEISVLSEYFRGGYHE